MFVGIDVAWPGRWHDETCTDNSNLWLKMHLEKEKWLCKDGIVLADSAFFGSELVMWCPGSELVMCPYTVADGSTAAQQWYNFAHRSLRFFVEETVGRWKNRFGCLLKEMEFTKKDCETTIFTTAVLHNICTVYNDLEEEYFNGTDSGSGSPLHQLSFMMLYPLNKVICPRCKKTSNGAMDASILPMLCYCHLRPMIDHRMIRIGHCRGFLQSIRPFDIS